MKLLSCRAALLSLVCLLSLATSASAECAWVLWEEISYLVIPPGIKDVPPTPKKRPEPSWLLRGAAAVKSDCDKAESERVKALRASYPSQDKTTPESPDSHVRVGIGPDGNRWPILHKFYCVPDTIDPRWPKRK